MNQRQYILALLLVGLIIGLNGCLATDPAEPTPTPDGGAALIVGRETIAVTLAALAQQPETYQGKQLRLTGMFTPQPFQICSEKAYPSPAAWGLSGDGFLAYAGGFDQLRLLVPKGLTMTVEGRWRRWRGPVGCGKQAVFTEIWFLDITRIVSPETLARVTLTPAGGDAGLLAQVNTPTAIVVGAETEPAPAPTEPGTPTAVPTLPPDEGEEELFPTDTATPELEPTATEEFEGEPDESPTATVTGNANTPGPGGTATATAGTPTLTPTTIGGTPAATSTPGTPGTPTTVPTALPSSTPGQGTVVDMGSMDAMFLAVEQLASGKVHRWNLTITAGNTVTAYAASLTENIVLTLLDNSGNVIIRQNSTGAAEIETLVQMVSQSGSYRLHVETTNGAPSDYVMMIRYNESYAFILRGIIRYGDSKSINLGAEQDHFWHFAGAAGDQVTITLVPDANSDPFLKLYDTQAEDISGFIDDGLVGESEQFTFTLPATGLYSIRVGEFNFGAMSYTLILARN